MSQRVAACLMCVPFRRFAQLWSNAAGIGLIASNSSFTPFRSFSFKTSAYRAASYALSGKISHPPKTMSFRSVRGTISLIAFSSPFSKRIVANCEIEPIGLANPLRAANVPVIMVVATAPPTPTTRIPSFPLASLTSIFSMSN